MTPVVNGLEAKFGSQISFRILNAGIGEGKDAFEFYRLPGHPSYVMLNPEGEILWQAFGPQSEATLETAMKEALDALTSGPLDTNRVESSPLPSAI
jgi:hypothetical protein